MIDVHFSVSRDPAGWVVKHNGGVLGHARSQSEAVSLAKGLLTWVTEQGREGDLAIDDPAVVTHPQWDPAQFR